MHNRYRRRESLTTVTSRVFAAIAFLIVSLPGEAHHSVAMFDATKSPSINGTVLKYEWTNPHVWIWIVTADKSGSDTTPYGFELASLAMLRRQGWSKDDLHVGDKVNVTYHPFKDGRNGGMVLQVRLDNGRVLGDQAALHDTPPGPTPSPAPSP
jgi:hypothetical protein